MDEQQIQAIKEEVWKTLKEVSKINQEVSQINKEISANRKKAKEEMRETDRQIKKEMRELIAGQKETKKRIEETSEQMKKTDEQMKKTDEQMKKTDEQMKKTDERLDRMGGRFDDRWGSLIESLVEGKIVELLQSREIEVTNTFSRATGSYWTEEAGVRKQKHREFDIVAANGSEVVAVEVKTTLKKRHIKYFISTLKDFKKYFRRYKTETVYGAVAYLKSKPEITAFAEEEGLFVIRATGDSASLINKKDFKPKAF